MTVKETNIFDFLYDKLYFDINKPIRLFEAFSGIGTQAMALKRLGYQVEHVGISEIDKHALKSYNAIHGEVKNYGGIGSFDRLPPNIDICTWSFPCQDISLAGKQKGMEDGTRSNYGYVFLDTVKNTPKEERPKVLLMENVRALFSAKFRDDWREIQLRLENMGYKNYAESLIATDFGVPQTRDRVFIVSIKGEYSYTFPKPFKLQKRLKDYLETKVDEKYYLSDKKIEQIVNWKAYNKPLENAKSVDDETIQTIKTSVNDIGVVVKDTRETIYSDKSVDKILSNIVDVNGVSKTITANPQRATIDSATLVVVKNPPLKIRKLTPLEAWRLMGIDDEDFYKAKASGISDSQLYKQAGNAIVVDVLYYIFKQFIKGE